MSDSRDTSASIKLAAVLLVPAALAVGWFLFPGGDPPALEPDGGERRAPEHGLNEEQGERRGNEPQAIDPPRIARSVADAGNYTYVELFENEDATFWIAAPRFEAKVGDRIVFVPAMEQKDFHSPTLGRTFDRLIFASAAQAVVGEGGNLPALGEIATHHPNSRQLPKLDPPAGGQAIAAVFADRKQLKGQEVKVRGTITKVNLGILGANWYHLRDGSGDQTSGDLTFTSQREFNLGQVVSLNGRLDVDHALGGDHAFAIFMADPQVTLERGPEEVARDAAPFEPFDAP